MNLLATMILSVVAELSSPGYVVYPVNDIITDPPRFNNAPDFQLRGDNRGQRGRRDGERRKGSRGFSQDKESRVNMIRMVIEEELASKGIKAKVFFFNGNFIVRVDDQRDIKKIQRSGKRNKNKRERHGR
jgi:hypothetical protein